MNLLKYLYYVIGTYLTDLRIRKLTGQIPPEYTPKVVVVGYGRHGKDTVTELLGKYGLKGLSTSKLLAESVVYPVLKDKYPNVEACYNDRHNHRELWFNIIKDAAKDDLGRIAELVFRRNNIYCGIRDIDQLREAWYTGLVDVTFWVDASGRMPPEGSESCTVRARDADYSICNNGSLKALEYNTAKAYLHFLERYLVTIYSWHQTVKITHKDYSPKLRIILNDFFVEEMEQKLGKECVSVKLFQGTYDE